MNLRILLLYSPLSKQQNTVGRVTLPRFITVTSFFLQLEPETNGHLDSKQQPEIKGKDKNGREGLP